MSTHLPNLRLLVDAYCDTCIISRKVLVGSALEPVNPTLVKHKLRSLGWTIDSNGMVRCPQCSEPKQGE